MQATAGNAQETSSTKIRLSLKQSVASWLVTPFFLLAFVSNLLLFDLLFRIAGRQSTRNFERCMRGINLSLLLLLRMVGTRFVVYHGHRRFRSEGPMVIAANHQSLFDIPILHELLWKYRPRFVAKRELARFLPGVSIGLRVGRQGIIDRQNPQQALEELDRLAAEVKPLKQAVAFFPEGTRARDGKLKPFKIRGLYRLISGSGGMPVLPVAIDGSWRLTHFKCFPIPVGVTINIAVGELMKFSESQSAPEVVEAVQHSVADLLQEMRYGNLKNPSRL